MSLIGGLSGSLAFRYASISCGRYFAASSLLYNSLDAYGFQFGRHCQFRSANKEDYHLWTFSCTALVSLCNNPSCTNINHWLCVVSGRNLSNLSRHTEVICDTWSPFDADTCEPSKRFSRDVTERSILFWRNSLHRCNFKFLTCLSG